jgi:hypothetical protein
MQLYIDDVLYDEGQIEAALRCARWVMTAYAEADPENGGGGEISWDTLGFAHEAACEVYEAEEFDAAAKSGNGVDE